MKGDDNGRRLLHRHCLHPRSVLNDIAGGGVRRLAGLRLAVPADFEPVCALLTQAGLPTHGVAESLHDFVVAVRDGVVVGTGGLEAADGHALMRSVVVRADEQGAGTGGIIVSRLLASARQRGLDQIWLLTETAPSFFARFGFRPAARDEAPAALRATAGFRACCGANAVAMRRRARALRVLVLCTANRCRSQITEALLRHVLGDRVVVASAGVRPGSGPHPLAIEVLAERGIDWRDSRSKSIEEVPGPWDLVITVCDDAREACPVLPGVATLHWDIPDPEGQEIAAFRSVATLLDEHVAAFAMAESRFVEWTKSIPSG